MTEDWLAKLRQGPVIVTRPSPDLETTQAALEEAGFRTIASPVMNIVHKAQPLPPRESYDALAFTSANGVRAWCAAGGPRDIPSFFIGTASASAGHDAGLLVANVSGKDVNSLADVILGTHPRPRILHVRGVDAAGDLVGRLHAGCVEAHGLVLYRAVPTEKITPPAVAAIKEGGATIALFSPRTTRLFLRLAEDQGLIPALRFCRFACLSPAVADMADDIQTYEILVAKAPSLLAFVDTLKADCA